MGPALELHDRLALADQAARSLPLLPRPALELEDQLLVETSPLRRLQRHAVLCETLRSAFDLEDAALAALRRVLRPQQRLDGQTEILEARMVRLRG